MKSTVKNAKTKDYMENLYKDKFYKIGRKLGYNTKDIKDAYNVVDFLKETFNPFNEERQEYENKILYLNPRDLKTLGNRIKTFAKLNHLANRQLWEMNLKDKNNKTIYK